MSDNAKYESDVNAIDVYDEIEIVSTYINPNINALAVLEHIINNNLTEIFPNFTIARRIFFTIPLTVASGERSFSDLKFIKNYLRSFISQDRLTNLALISIENKIAVALDLTGLIK